jgi:2-amino-4-hydroxy-6-hydroxymethyldihydropteridine diphosphokinase
MNTAYIGIGSNLGDRYQNCLKAIEMMREIPGCGISALSGWYLTQPIGVTGQEWYVNGAAGVSTTGTAEQLLAHLLSIEKFLGRVRSRKWEPRVIDLDILLFGKEMIDADDLRIPHPLMHLRRFVLAPLAEIAPDVIHPRLGLSILELLRGLPKEDSEVLPLRE